MSHLVGSGLFCENPGDDGHSGEDIQDDGEFEGEDSEEARDFGDIEHKDVIGVFCGKNSRFLLSGCCIGNGILGWLFLQDSPHGSFGKFPSSPGEGLCDTHVSTESSEGHGVNELSDDIAVASDGRFGLDQGADGLSV